MQKQTSTKNVVNNNERKGKSNKPEHIYFLRELHVRYFKSDYFVSINLESFLAFWFYHI